SDIDAKKINKAFPNTSVKAGIKETVPEKAMKMKVFKDEKTAQVVSKIKKQVNEIGKKQFPGFEIPAETKRELLQRKLQDKMNRLGVVQKEIKKAGGKIDEASDAYLQQELFYGRAGNAIESFDKDFVEPFVKKAKDNKITIDELGDYLYAKHAPERNAKISTITPDILKGGSGMSNEEATAILKGFESSGKSAKLDELANEFYENVTKKRLQILRDSGLEKSEALDLLEQGYKNYVPLKGKAGKTSTAKIGQGFSVTGKDIKRAFGRESKADNPFVQSVLDYQETLIRSEKNKVSQSFLKMVEDNPNPKLWEVENLQYTPRYDKTGEIAFMDPHFKFADNVLQVKVDGKVKMITIKDQKLANAMKNIGVERGIQQLNTLNRYLRSINTTLNPEFIISNFERDLQTASINISGEQSAKMAANTAKNIPKAMRGIWKNVRKGDKTSEWSKVYEELKQGGGKTGFFDMKTLDEKKKQLESSIKLYGSSKTSDKLKSTVKAAGDYIDNANEMVEMAVRTSAYKEALANGMSKEKAASLAKNLTVNFNKKGEFGPILNSLYLFSNASIQGSARVLTALKHKKVRYIVGGITAGTFALDEYNRNVNEQEYKKISDYEKNSNIIIMQPDGNHFKIALPYGFNIFKIIGDISNDVVHKDINPEDAGKRFLLALDDVYNPLSSGSLNQLISPTALDPMVQVAENKNFAGSPIKPEQPMYGAKKKESSLYWNSVRPQTKAVTDWLNKITGGSEIEAGYVDISPENVDAITDNLMGSVGKFIANTISSGSSLIKGESPDLDNIPVVRKFVAGPNEYWATSTIREVKDKSGIKELTDVDTKKLKEAIKDGIKNEKLTQEDALKTFKEVMSNQTKIKAGRIYSQLENATSEEKKAAVKDLTPEEIKALIKIIKDKAKQ
ncbi:MAG: LPD38 domain-containing protein, partial [Candidatus Paceibacterota bacterium]